MPEVLSNDALWFSEVYNAIYGANPQRLAAQVAECKGASSYREQCGTQDSK